MRVNAPREELEAAQEAGTRRHSCGGGGARRGSRVMHETSLRDYLRPNEPLDISLSTGKLLATVTIH